MSLLMHKGYAAAVEFSADDDAFIGRVAGINDTITFHGDTVAELKQAFTEAVDFYLDTCEARGEAPNKPYAGKLMLRVPPDLHAKVAMMAQASHKSVNQWAIEVFSRAAVV
jgi:predicted HicB family RNase H-like nuclease